MSACNLSFKDLAIENTCLLKVTVKFHKHNVINWEFCSKYETIVASIDEWTSWSCGACLEQIASCWVCNKTILAYSISVVEFFNAIHKDTGSEVISIWTFLYNTFNKILSFCVFNIARDFIWCILFEWEVDIVPLWPKQILDGIKILLSPYFLETDNICWHLSCGLSSKWKSEINCWIKASC